MTRHHQIWSIFSVIFFALILTSCSGDDTVGDSGTTPGSETTYTYEFDNGGGDVSTVVFSRTSWGITDALNGTTYNTASGTITRLPNGIAKVTITSSDDGTEIGDYMYAVEIPGGMLFVMEANLASGGDQWNGTINAFPFTDVGIATGGSCSGIQAGDLYHGIATLDESFAESSETAWGQAAFSTGTTGLQVDITEYTLAQDATASPGSSNFDNMTCTGNTLSNVGGDEVVVTPSGIAFLSGTGVADLLLVPELTGLAVTTVEAAGRSYGGISFAPHNVGGGGMGGAPVDVFGGTHSYIGSPDVMYGRGYTGGDVDSGQFDMGISAIDGSATASGGDGLFDDTFIDASTQARFIAHEMPDGKYALFGVHDTSNSPSDNVWEIIVLMQNGDAVTVPTTLDTDTSGTVYFIPEEDDAGNQVDITVEVDPTSNLFWAYDTLGQVFWGTVTRLSNGFLSFTQTGATDPGDKLDPAVTFAGIDIPGSLLQLFFDSDEGGETEGVTGFVLGGCPIGTTDYNILTMPTDSNYELDAGASVTNEFIGTTVLDEVSTVYSLTQGALTLLSDAATTATDPGTLAAGSCVTGPPDFVDFSPEQIFFFNNGLAFMEDSSGPSDSYLMMPIAKAPASPSITGKEYRGWAEEARYDTSSGQWVRSVTPIYARDSGTTDILTVGPYGNVLANQEDAASAATANVALSSISSGLNLAGTIDTGTTLPFPYMVMEDDTNSSIQIVIGIFHDTTITSPVGSGRSDWTQIFLIEQ